MPGFLSRVPGVLLFLAGIVALIGTAGFVVVGVSMIDRSPTLCESTASPSRSRE